MIGSDLWDEVLSRIEAKVNRHSFYTWFKPTSFVEERDGRVQVRVPNSLFRDWLTKHYSAVIDEAFTELDRPGTAIVFVTDEACGPRSARRPRRPRGPPEPGATEKVRSAASSTPSSSDRRISSLMPRAARLRKRRRALQPAVHLRRSRARQDASDARHWPVRGPSRRNLKLTYISSERFMNEMINAVRYDRIIDFASAIAAWTSCWSTTSSFSPVRKARRPSSSTPSTRSTIRRSRLYRQRLSPPRDSEARGTAAIAVRMGMIADIQSPDLETKIAILKKKAETEGVPLPDNVAIYIARKIKSNIRELEGSLIRLIAYASLTGQEISLPLAQDVLRNILQNDESARSRSKSSRSGRGSLQLKLGDLKSRNNSKSVAMPRQIAMYLCKALTNASLPEIGQSFGGKHHSTVIHSIRKIENSGRRTGISTRLSAASCSAFAEGNRPGFAHCLTVAACGQSVAPGREGGKPQQDRAGKPSAKPKRSAQVNMRLAPSVSQRAEARVRRLDADADERQGDLRRRSSPTTPMRRRRRAAARWVADAAAGRASSSRRSPRPQGRTPPAAASAPASGVSRMPPTQPKNDSTPKEPGKIGVCELPQARRE